MEGNRIPGIIVAKPPCVIEDEERNKVVRKSSMFIDIGCTNEKEAKKLNLRIGNPIILDSKFGIW